MEEKSEARTPWHIIEALSLFPTRRDILLLGESMRAQETRDMYNRSLGVLLANSDREK